MSAGPSGTQRRLRVLWLIKGLGPGGAERLLVSHAGAADPGGKVVYETAYLLPWKAHLVPELEALGVRTHLLGKGGQWDLRWALALRRLLARELVDVIHCHSPYPAAIARLVTRTLRRRHRPALVSTEHNCWDRHPKITRLANRLTFGLDDVHLAVSEGVREALPASLRPAVEVQMQGIDVAAVRRHGGERAAVRAELGIAPEELLVVTIANLRASKCYPDLLEAARQVLASGAPVRFVAIGQGPLEEELRGQLDRLGLGDGFRFLGYRQDARRILAGGDLFVLSSRYEGLPVSLMEALALGLPVVSTAVGGVPEAVTDGQEGILVAPGRPELLAEAITSLQADVERRERMALAARARAEAFDVAPVARKLEALYRSLADSHPRPAASAAP